MNSWSLQYVWWSKHQTSPFAFFAAWKSICRRRFLLNNTVPHRLSLQTTKSKCDVLLLVSVFYGNKTCYLNKPPWWCVWQKYISLQYSAKCSSQSRSQPSECPNYCLSDCWWLIIVYFYNKFTCTMQILVVQLHAHFCCTVEHGGNHVRHYSNKINTQGS